MSKEAILRVRQAEAEASDIRARAEAAAAKRIEENEQTCASEAARQIDQAAAELKTQLKEVGEKADALIQRSRMSAGDDAAALEQEAGHRMQEAVRIVVWEMFDTCQ